MLPLYVSVQFFFTLTIYFTPDAAQQSVTRSLIIVARLTIFHLVFLSILGCTYFSYFIQEKTNIEFLLNIVLVNLP